VTEEAAENTFLLPKGLKPLIRFEGGYRSAWKRCATQERGDSG